MSKITDATQWFYFNPVFGEANIEASGRAGILKSGVNLAIWATAVGIGAKLAGSTRPHFWALGFFGAAVVGEVLFGLSGPSTNGDHMQIGNVAAPGTAAPAPPWAGTPGASVSFGEQNADQGFGEAGGGYN